MRVNLMNIWIVLNETRYPENIGAAARACCNMGITRLAVVCPRRLDRSRILKMATHEASHIVENMLLFGDLKEALSDFNFVVGTTARTGRHRLPTHGPRQLARTVAPISQTNKVALLFGSENSGLTNKHLEMCQAIVTIPTAGFSSINLAQSVMILCYEMFCARPETVKSEPKLATLYELEGMYQHLSEMFGAVGLVNPQHPSYWLNMTRRFLGRYHLKSKEVRLIRGLCRQILRTLSCAKQEGF